MQISLPFYHFNFCCKNISKISNQSIEPKLGMGQRKTGLEVALYAVLMYGHIAGSRAQYCMYYENNDPCGGSYPLEQYKDVAPWNRVTRSCCNPNVPGYNFYDRGAYECRVTSCQSSSTANLCGGLVPRYKGQTLLQYEEIKREPCSRGQGQSDGLKALCCVKGSEESYLATKLGAEENEFPHQVHVHSGRGLCGGTIYNSKFIVTAAHCVVNLQEHKADPVDGVWITVGSNLGLPDDPKLKYKAKKTYVHDKYGGFVNPPTGKDNYNDIALIELDSEIEFGPTVKSMEIAPEGFDPLQYAEAGVINGWGYTYTNQLTGSAYLHKANMLIRRDESCFNPKVYSWSAYKGYSDQMMCVGGIWEGTWSENAGEGDSGGGFICRGEDGKALLCGINSFVADGEKCYRTGDPKACMPVMTVEVQYFNKWIKDRAGEQDPSTFYKPTLYGEDVSAKKYPHQVHITSSDGKPCGGTLITKDLVVTAAHCVFNVDRPGRSFLNLKATSGMDTVDGSGGKTHGIKPAMAQVQGFERVGIPAQYQNKGIHKIFADHLYKDDLAIVKLDSPADVDESMLPKIPDYGFSADSGLELSFPKETNFTSGMRARQFKILDKGDCQARMDRLSYIGLHVKLENNVVCGVEEFSGGSTCDRELGGGLICKGKMGEDVLCGVQTFRLCEQAIPNIFTAPDQTWVNGVKDALAKY